MDFRTIDVLERLPSNLHRGACPESVALQPVVQVHECHDYIAEKRTDEPFDGLLGAKADELCAAKCTTNKVCGRVIPSNAEHWEEIPVASEIRDILQTETGIGGIKRD